MTLHSGKARGQAQFTLFLLFFFKKKPSKPKLSFYVKCSNENLQANWHVKIMWPLVWWWSRHILTYGIRDVFSKACLDVVIISSKILTYSPNSTIHLLETLSCLFQMLFLWYLSLFATVWIFWWKCNNKIFKSLVDQFVGC